MGAVGVNLLSALAGYPDTKVLSGTSLETTDPAPMMQRDPIFTPSRMIDPVPIQTSSPIVIPFFVGGCL